MTMAGVQTTQTAKAAKATDTANKAQATNDSTASAANEQKTQGSSGGVSSSLIASVKRHEGTGKTTGTAPNRTFLPYTCPAGFLTIGYGFKVDCLGKYSQYSQSMPESVAEVVLAEKLKEIIIYLRGQYAWFSTSPQVVQDVVTEMVFQLGQAGFGDFKKAIAAFAAGDYEKAADEMLDSKWAKNDSPNRAQEEAALVRSAKQGGGAVATKTETETTDTSSTGGESASTASTGPGTTNNVKININKASRTNRGYGYSYDTWCFIQTAVGLTGNDVDGVPGPVTSQAIANWQAAHGFTGNDVDGICGKKTLAALKASQASTPAKEPEQTKEPEQAKPENKTPEQANPGESEQSTASGILSASEASNALNWNNNKNYSAETIQKIKSVVGGDSGSAFTLNDVQKIAAWQKKQGLHDVDGKFGSGSCTSAGITPTYNISNTHTLGSNTPDWCTQHGFINGKTLDTLEGEFKTTAENVIGGIRDAGGSVNITSTLRHPARAAVMYYARYLSKTSQVMDIFNKYGIDVNGTQSGAIAARNAFGIGNNAVGLNSNHIYGHALDMTISSLPGSFAYGSTTVQTGGNQGGWIANARALDKALQNAGISNFKWYGNGDEVHWSTNGR